MGNSWCDYETLLSEVENEINRVHVESNSFTRIDFDPIKQRVYKAILNCEVSEQRREWAQECLDNYHTWLIYLTTDTLRPYGDPIVDKWERIGLELIKIYDLALRDSVSFGEKTLDFVRAAINNRITLAGYAATAIGGYGTYKIVETMLTEGIASLVCCMGPIFIALLIAGVVDLSITQFPGDTYKMLRSAKNCHKMYGKIRQSVKLYKENSPCHRIGVEIAEKLLED